VDPTVEARHGDFVCILWDRETLAEIRKGDDNPKWLEMYGRNPPVIAGKYLYEWQGRYFLVVRNAMWPLGRNRILGVVRRRERNGVPLYAPRISHIGPNAVTVQVASHLAGPVGMSASGPFYNGVIHSFSPPTDANPATLKVIATYSVYRGSANGTQTTRLRAVIGGVVHDAPTEPFVGGSILEPQQRTIQASFPYGGDNTVQFVTISLLWVTAGFPAGATYSDIDFQVEFSKR
jgi:hypothetical protein